ncbi:hypothetical protein ACQP2U_21670 [Nocardia sp. CA-084685]|uniref:hypothetical protein n=1 Tax=Nocardia sp. CA-084685 TaxID=3239970 RepID=UPI003D977DE8
MNRLPGCCITGSPDKARCGDGETRTSNEAISPNQKACSEGRRSRQYRRDVRSRALRDVGKEFREPEWRYREAIDTDETRIMNNSGISTLERHEFTEAENTDRAPSKFGWQRN